MMPFSVKNLTLEVLLALMLLLTLLYIWGKLAPISSATQASGHVRVEGYRKKVVPLDAGIIKEIYVSENNPVTQGQLLIEFNSTETLATLNELSKQLLKTKLNMARFLALSKLTKMDTKTFQNSTPLNEETAQHIRYTGQLQYAQLNQYYQQHELINQEMKQHHSNIQWSAIALEQSQKKVALLKTERIRLNTLLKKKFSSHTELNLLDIEISKLVDEMIAKQAKISQLKLALDTLKLSKKNLTNDFYSNNLTELNTLSAEKWRLEKQLSAVQLKLARTRVLAPVAGTVINLQTHTVGEAIANGAYLMDIVPQKAQLVIEAELAAQDIELVQAGDAAKIRLINYNPRHHNPLPAQVKQVSADRFLNDKGQSFYRLLLEIDNQALAQQTHIKLYPGMPVEALILGDKRTLFDYLLSPITLGIERSLRE